MANTHQQNIEQQYSRLINKHNKYLQEKEQFRLINRQLAREVQKLQALNEVVYSADYQHKINEVINKYQQYQVLQQEYAQLLKEEKVKPENLEKIKVQNLKLREKMIKLEFEVSHAEIKDRNFQYKTNIYSKYLNKDEQQLSQCENDLQNLQKENPFEQSMWSRLARSRIKNLLLQAEDKQQQMNNEEEINLTDNGLFFRLIYQKVNQVQQLNKKMEEQYKVLKHRGIESQELKRQNDDVSKTFGFDRIGNENDDQQNLRKEEEQLEQEIKNLNQQIQKQIQAKDHLELNLDQIAKAGAVQKTRDYLQQMGNKIEQNLKTVEEVLPVVEIGGDQTAKLQVKQMKYEIIRIRQQQLEVFKTVGNATVF